MRVIGGTARGRRLKSPDNWRTRPTSDRVRESLFNLLAPWVTASLFLDLYAGTGAVAIEAISRGAKHAAMVEHDRIAIRILLANLQLTGFQTNAKVYQCTVERAIAQMQQAREQFDLIFCDPPYNTGLAETTIAWVNRASLLASEGLLVVETGVGEQLAAQVGNLVNYRRLVYGDTALWFYQIGSL